MCQASTCTKANKWYGVFYFARSAYLSVVFQGYESRGLTLSNQPQAIRFNSKSIFFFVLENSCTLSMQVANDTGEGNQANYQDLSFFGRVFGVRIQSVIKGPKKRKTLCCTTGASGISNGIWRDLNSHRCWANNNLLNSFIKH
jgi:hypothetical protein